MKINEIITHFQLEKHPEGGYFKEIYRCKNKIPNSVLGTDFEGDRNICTGIYFLLTSENFSAFHQIKQDEIWHFYEGSSLKIHMIAPNGTYSFFVLGLNYKNNEAPQFTVPANYWFAAEVLQEDSFTFVGCTVAPGFDFRDFTLAKQDDLLIKYPHLQDIIQKFTNQ